MAEIKTLIKKTIFYTISTTIIADTIALITYLFIDPSNVKMVCVHTKILPTTTRLSFSNINNRI
ncbi:hypothetical protein [Ehrlichia muris]|uniref:hypothetical protein n=1 Tax=Ehrlichia muris TaxID=35795 RepID=UPI0037BF4A88